MDINEMSAWGISQAMAQLIEQGFVADDETGEVFFVPEDIDSLQEAFEDKINGLCGYIRYSESKAKAFKERKAELEANQKYYETRAENLKKYLNSLMLANGKEKGMDTKDFRVSFRKSTASDIYDAEALKAFIESKPEYKEKYLSYKEPEFVKKALSDDLKNKVLDKIPGFQLVENKNIQIK